MDVSTWVLTLAAVLFVVYFIALCLTDCDLGVAWTERFGKPIASLKHKVVWVTGASSGIGEHLAVTLARHGVRLVLSARRNTELERVKRKCLGVNKQLRDEDILVLPLDITRVDTHEGCFQNVIDHFGGLDILVNNAGRSQIAVWEKIGINVDKQLFDINVFGVISLSRLAVNYFLGRGAGHVAVTSSLAGVIGLPFSSSYTASKWAIHGYFNSLRLEKSRKNINITIFCPGQTYTNVLNESFTENDGEKYSPESQPERQMNVERCGELYAIVLANEISEAWVARNPFIVFCYIMSYYPIIGKILLKGFNPEQFKPHETIKAPIRNN